MTKRRANVPDTIMRRETLAIPALLGIQLSDHLADYRAAGRELRRRDPGLVVTSARGSSDNAALYFKYLTELCLGLPVASIGPSLASVYRRRMKLDRVACLSVSQSGRSPDLVSFQTMAGAAAAYRLALVNTIPSPLSAVVDRVLPIGCGEERAVAATKSFVCALTAIVAVVAAWSEDDALLEGLLALPDPLEAALACDWSELADALAPGRSAYVIGRGPAMAICQEAALKFKETCQLHAESYSAAEVLHGPIQLAASGLVALVFLGRDESREGTLEAIRRMTAAGIRVFVADPAGQPAPAGATLLPSVAAPVPMLDPIAQIVSFYVFVERLAAGLGLDPDAPSLLRKVTETT